MRSSRCCDDASRPSKRRSGRTSATQRRTVSARSRQLLGEIDLLLVIGSRNSSNSNRLVEVARSGGVAAHLIDDESEIEHTWLAGVESVGITSGASAPESLVRRVVSWFRERGVEEIRSQTTVLEDVSFRLPAELRQRRPLPRAEPSRDLPPVRRFRRPPTAAISSRTSTKARPIPASDGRLYVNQPSNPPGAPNGSSLSFSAPGFRDLDLVPTRHLPLRHVHLEHALLEDRCDVLGVRFAR